MTIRLKAPRVRAVLGDPDDPSTWEEHTLQCIGRDMQATERMLNTLKMGSFGQNPITAQAMLAYQALRRTGAISTNVTWNDFEQAYVEVTDPVDEQRADEVRPTSPAAGPEY